MMTGTMAEATAARVAAFEVLARVRRGELADRAVTIAGSGLAPVDRAWFFELTYGTIRFFARIDHYLAAFVRGGLERLEPRVHDVLRLGAYQLLEMDGVPEYAAISQSVELVRAVGSRRAAGFVNGVLQSLRRGKDTVRFPSFERDPLGYLTTWGSHPAWLVERWIQRFGAAETRALVEANNTRPAIYLTPIGISPDEVTEQLAAAGIEASRVDEFPGSVRLASTGELREALSIVPAVVQDPAAASVVWYAAVPEGATVIDLSSAPGGKAAGIAAGAGFTAAADVSLRRIGRVKENFDRLGLFERAALVVADGRNPPFRPVDMVLLDAPCTGTGTFRRHPDGRWRVKPHDLEALVALQRELLQGAAEIVRPGGTLVYATCSLEPEENESQVEWFLSNDQRFIIDAEEAPGAARSGTMGPETYLTVLPHREGVDGAFAARLRRIQ